MKKIVILLVLCACCTYVQAQNQTDDFISPLSPTRDDVGFVSQSEPDVMPIQSNNFTCLLDVTVNGSGSYSFYGTRRIIINALGTGAYYDESYVTLSGPGGQTATVYLSKTKGFNDIWGVNDDVPTPVYWTINVNKIYGPAIMLHIDELSND